MSKIIIVTVKYVTPIKKIPGMETIIIDNSPPLENRGFARGANIGIKKALSYKTQGPGYYIIRQSWQLRFAADL